MTTLSLEDAETLVETNDKYWWETYAKVLVSFRPGRGAVYMRPDGYYNRGWRGKKKWGTIRRYEINNEGKFII